MESLRERFKKEGVESVDMKMPERLALLEKTRLGSGFSSSELQMLACYIDPWQAKPGTYICRQGDESEFFCLICRGRVEVLRDDFQHAHKEIATIGPGQTVGEMAFLDGDFRSASVVVETPVLFLIINRKQFNLMAEDTPQLWGKLLMGLTITIIKRLRQTSGILAEYLQS